MGFWRTEDPVMDFDGRVPKVIKGGMWSHQREWWALQNFIKLLVGGYGSGKSEIICKWSIAGALHNAPSWSAIVSPSFPQARRTIIPTLTRLLNGKMTVRKDMRWRHNKSDHTFTIDIECRPQATILYLSGDDPDSLKGPNLGQAALDEPFIQQFAVFEQMISRLRDPQAQLIQMGMAGTPEQLNWGYELVEGELKDRYDVGYVNADTRANLALPKGYAERLIKGFDPKAAEAYVQGRFVNLSKGRVFYGFDRDRNVKRIAPYSAVHFVGMDFNVNPMSFVVGWHQGNRAHIYAEYELPNSDTEYACSIIREKHPEVRLVFPDPSGRARHTNAPGGASDFTWIARAGLVVMAPIASWARRDSYNALNHMYADGRLTIDPDCKRLIRYLQEHTHELMTRQASMTHLLDAHRYPITYLFPVHRPSSNVSQIQGA
ncbi:MAG: hypothetical protein E6R03_17360 [Hyphomicrobiaceae bacterium]|nr:MAG: hypothetical protein E6R03_17360 [Hyphomicrobiaceae bacterium]